MPVNQPAPGVSNQPLAPSAPNGINRQLVQFITFKSGHITIDPRTNPNDFAMATNGYQRVDANTVTTTFLRTLSNQNGTVILVDSYANSTMQLFKGNIARDALTFDYYIQGYPSCKLKAFAQDLYIDTNSYTNLQALGIVGSTATQVNRSLSGATSSQNPPSTNSTTAPKGVRIVASPAAQPPSIGTQNAQPPTRPPQRHIVSGTRAGEKTPIIDPSEPVKQLFSFSTSIQAAERGNYTLPTRLDQGGYNRTAQTPTLSDRGKEALLSRSGYERDIWEGTVIIEKPSTGLSGVPTAPGQEKICLQVTTGNSLVGEKIILAPNEQLYFKN